MVISGNQRLRSLITQSLRRLPLETTPAVDTAIWHDKLVFGCIPDQPELPPNIPFFHEPSVLLLGAFAELRRVGGVP